MGEGLCELGLSCPIEGPLPGGFYHKCPCLIRDVGILDGTALINSSKLKCTWGGTTEAPSRSMKEKNF